MRPARPSACPPRRPTGTGSTLVPGFTASCSALPRPEQGRFFFISSHRREKNDRQNPHCELDPRSCAGEKNMDHRSNQAKSIFLAAIEEYAPEQWPVFLEQACAGDALLRAEVEK